MLTTLLLLPMTAAPAPQQPASGRADTCRELWFDIDADGYEDLLVLTPGAPDRLLRNAGDGTFVDATTGSGLGATQSTDAQLEDLDRDGHKDLLLVGAGSARLFRGLAGGQFEEATTTSGLAAFSGVQSAAWVDFDKDGLMDLRLRTTAGFQLLRNQGGLGFQPVELGLPPIVAQTTAGVPATIVVTSPAEGDRYSASPGSPGSDPIYGAGAGAGSGNSGSNGPGSTVPVGPGFDSSSAGGAMAIGPFCAESVRDQATGDCVTASSEAMLGMLYPLSMDLFVDSVTGNVGFGTTSPASPISLDNGLFQVGITQAQVGGGATMELTTEDSSGDQATRILMRGGNGGDTANIEFYTGARGAEAQTMIIDGPTGNVGIGISAPEASLHVAGDVKLGGDLEIDGAISGHVRINGLIETGSGVVTADAPDLQFDGTWPGYRGMHVRRAISRQPTNGDVVAIAHSATVRLERDGTNGGMKITWDPLSPNNLRVFAATWIDGSGATGSFYKALTNPEVAAGGSVSVFSNADDVKMFRFMIGDPFNGRGHTEVSMFRFNNDRIWVGSIISSTDQ